MASLLRYATSVDICLFAFGKKLRHLSLNTRVRQNWDSSLNPLLTINTCISSSCTQFLMSSTQVFNMCVNIAASLFSKSAMYGQRCKDHHHNISYFRKTNSFPLNSSYSTFLRDGYLSASQSLLTYSPWGPGCFKTRIGPPYPKRVVKDD